MTKPRRSEIISAGGRDTARSLPRDRPLLPLLSATPCLKSENRSRSRLVRSLRTRRRKSPPAEAVAASRSELQLSSGWQPPLKPAAERVGRAAAPVAKRAAGRAASESHGGAGMPSADPVAPVRRDTAVASGGKMRSLDRPSGGGEKKGADAGKGKRREPRINVKMASFPEVAEPAPAKPAAGEPESAKAGRQTQPRCHCRAPPRDAGTARAAGKGGHRKETRRAARAKRGGLSGFTGEKAKRTGEAAEEDKPRKKLAGMASPRAERTRGKGRSTDHAGSRGGYGGGMRSRSLGTQKRKGVNTAAPRKDAVVLELPCTIRSFSEAAGMLGRQSVGHVDGMGMQSGLNINSQLDLETAEVIAGRIGS